MTDERTETLHCVDCGTSGEAARIALHPGAVSAPSDEGHVRYTQIALCAACASRRFAVQDPTFV
jgi:hypothetical protein